MRSRGAYAKTCIDKGNERTQTIKISRAESAKSLRAGRKGSRREERYTFRLSAQRLDIHDHDSEV
jgi:hypothetical protein